MKIKAIDGREIDLKTGDELLCSGNGKLSKKIIWYNGLVGAKGEAKEISHVAKFIDGQVFEATTLNEWCGKKGYQANYFYVWLHHYNGRVWVRQTEGLVINEDEYVREAVKLLGAPYESGIPGILELLLTSVSVKTPLLKDLARQYLETKSLHCSEANVILSQNMGYYDPKARANKYPPYKFWTGGEYEKGFLRGKLLEPVRIK